MERILPLTPTDPAVLNTERLSALRRTQLLDSAAEERFDRLTRLAVNTLRVPVALLSLVDEDRQFFKSCIGLPAAFLETRQTPLTHSFCQHTVVSREPLIVTDARTDPRMVGNLAIRDLGVMAYAGIPLKTPDGHVLGSFCVIDTKPRQWTTQEIEILKDLTESAMTEISLRTARDAAEQANRAKDRFLAMLSHELRTPLSPALMIVTSMAEDASLPQLVRDDASTVKRNIEHQTRLIDDLLDVSRIENGKMALRSEPLDLHAVVSQAVELCRPYATERSIALDVQPGARRHTVVGDATRLRQVFSNLLKNAIKFSPQGGSVAITTEDRPGDCIRVSVRDQGIGIDATALPAIFDAFEQGRRSSERGHSDGLGLGLAICKGIVDAHRGTLAAFSEGAHRGTELVVELQTARQTLAPAFAPPPREPSAGQLPAQVSILLVDDHADTLRLMARLLRNLEHRVTTAASVSEGIAAAESQCFDLLISDIGLPDGTGIDLMQALQKKRSIRGIALTGYGMEEDLRKTRDAGFCAHLTKPIDFHALEQTINEVVTTPATD